MPLLKTSEPVTWNVFPPEVWREIRAYLVTPAGHPRPQCLMCGESTRATLPYIVSVGPFLIHNQSMCLHCWNEIADSMPMHGESVACQSLMEYRWTVTERAGYCTLRNTELSLMGYCGSYSEAVAE